MKNLKSALIIISAIIFGVLWFPLSQNGTSSENLQKNDSNGAEETGRLNSEDDSLAQAITKARYGVEEYGGKFYADNPANKMTAVFDAAGNFRLQSANKDLAWQTDWKLKSVGYGANQTAAGGGSWQSSENRVELRRDEIGLTEYFENRPDGLEQGFILCEKTGEGGRRFAFGLGNRRRFECRSERGRADGETYR